MKTRAAQFPAMVLASRIAEAVRGIIAAVVGFLQAGRMPTLASYTRRRARGWVLMRRFALFAGTVLIAMIYGFYFALLPPFLYVYMAVPIGVLALAVIWALPDSDAIPERAIRFLFFGLVIAIGLWPGYLALALPGQPWISSRRLFTIPMFLLFLISFSMSPRMRGDLKDALGTSKPLWIAMLIYIGICFATIFVSNYPATSFNKFLVAQLEWTLPFLVAVWVFRDPRYVRLFIGIVLAIITYQGLIGLWEHAIQGVPWAPYVPRWLKGDVELVDQILAGARRYVVGTHRSAGTWSTPLSYAEFLALLTPILFLALWYGRKLWHSLAAAALIALAVTVIIFSQSRLGLVGTLAGLVLFVLIVAIQQWRVDKVSLFPPALIIGYPVIAATLIGLTFASRRLEIIVWGAGHTASSDAGREIQTQKGIAAIQKWPFGYGMGNAADQAGIFSPTGILTLDTYYVTVAVDAGVLGFLCYYFMFLYAGGRAGLLAIAGRANSGVTRLLVALSCSMAIFVVTKSVLSQDETHCFVFILLGLTVALIHQAKNGENGGSARG